MKTTLITVSAALVALLGFAAQLQANYIQGGFSITGSVKLDGPAVAATSVLSYSGVKVSDDPTGDFANIVHYGDSVTMATPWVFAKPLDNFWQVDGFTFDLLSVTKVSREGGTELGAVVVEGLGRVTGHSFDATEGTIYFRADDRTKIFSFLAKSEYGLQIVGTGGIEPTGAPENPFGPAPTRPTPVPDGGTTLALLGCGLSLLGAATRKYTR
jgi:hypothetical protein